MPPVPSSLRPRVAPAFSHTRRSSSRPEPRFNYLPSPFPSPPSPASLTYPLLTARSLLTRRTPPTRARLLVRDFIDDSLYNPHYGYFATQVEIFDPDQGLAEGVAQGGRGFEFGKMRNMREFEEEVGRRYGVFEGRAGGTERGRQVWHTPTELFKPWYGRALARFLVSEYKLHLYPYSDLIIYEIGAGNGTLMRDILDYLRVSEPEVYERTRYRIVEISERLQGVQRKTNGGDGGAREGATQWGHADKVEVIGGSIFDWDRVVPEPCFFLALEVLDNFAHDIVRYSTSTHLPYQCTVTISPSGDFTESYVPLNDPLLSRYLSLLPPPPPRFPKWVSNLPFAPNLGEKIWVPTKQLLLLETLRDKFPNHRVLFSDFDRLPDAVAGRNGPVVQTRYKGETIPCSTYLVQPGFFDIFFPTDFAALRRLYSLVMSPSPPSPPLPSSHSATASLSPTLPTRTPSALAPPTAFFSPSSSSSGGKPTKPLRTMGHAEFLERWGEVDRTRLRDGSSPMLEGYENAKFIL